MYTPALSVLSKEIILLIRPYEPALELCRLSNIDDREKASLETVRILSLPVFAPHIIFFRATCFDKHPGPSARQPEDRVGARRRLHFVPMDSMVIINMIVLGRACVIDLTVRRSTLLELINAQPQAGATYAAETGVGVGTMLTIPWENWGPTNTRIRVLHVNSRSRIFSSFTGERRVTAQRTRRTHIVMRDYNPFRVQRALMLLGGAGREVMLGCGSVVKVVKEPSVYRAGGCFRDDIETSLPYVETATIHGR